ncbi:MAG: hypothetical protein RQ833_07700 [Sphingomonadaceae bacterium]|nr:hypothetical protein [Sphingomonadaceae bacterium]
MLRHLVIAAAGLLAVGTMEAQAAPPPWAPAYGYRAHEARREWRAERRFERRLARREARRDWRARRAYAYRARCHINRFGVRICR